jgi:hypothetical protein
MEQAAGVAHCNSAREIEAASDLLSQDDVVTAAHVYARLISDVIATPGAARRRA